MRMSRSNQALTVAPLALLLGCTAAVAEESKGSEDDALPDGAFDTIRSPTSHGQIEFGVPQVAALTDLEGYHAWEFELFGSAMIDARTYPAPHGPFHLDTVLYLYRATDRGWGSYIARNDDADESTLWSRIAGAAGVGRYRILVKGYKRLVTGAFAVAVDCEGAGCARPVDPCAAGREPVSLTPIDSASLIAAGAAYDASCISGGQWCSLSAIAGLETPMCPDTDPTLGEVVDLAIGADPEIRGTFTDGAVLSRAELQGTAIFGTSYSPMGPALLSAIDAWAGSTDLEAWLLDSEVACHNCTGFESKYVLFYVPVRRVVVIDAGHGHDS